MAPPPGDETPNSTPSTFTPNNESTNKEPAFKQAESSDKMHNPKSKDSSSNVGESEGSKKQLSREGSPTRPQARAGQNKLPSISRRNSQELSPTRGSLTPTSSLPAVPSAAAVQRALSATRIPHLQPLGADSIVENSQEGRANATKSEDNPQWPISPRLKSPPPASRKSPTTARKTDSNSTQTPITKLSTVSTPDLTKGTNRQGSESEDTGLAPGHKPTGRGASVGSTLETVAEGSVPNTPITGSESTSYGFKASGEGSVPPAGNGQSQAIKGTVVKEGGESGTESGSGKSRSGVADDREQTKANLTMTATKPPMMPSKRSFTSLKPSSRSMTVETETVSSIPQVSLGVGAGDRGNSAKVEPSGSVRLKPSTETIRPRKEKKKASRKPTSVNAGTVSSKADIFEAKVASAVDEASSSDSDETFVYESNPPDSHASRPTRHHSRTPSATSMASQADGTSSRYRSGNRDIQHSVTGKRSMKFTNSAYNSNLDGENSAGSGRGAPRSGTPTARHHHIGRYGRGGHTGLFDHDSPFTQAGKTPTSPKGGVINTSRLSRPSSPRVNGLRNGTPTRKGEVYGQDFDDEAADDERTPLVGSVRINRVKHGRRPNSASLRQMEYMEQRERGFFSRFCACLIVTLLLLILLVGAAAFVVALTKPLTEVTVKHIQNVLASEQELMLDLDVRATNPNLFAITVSDLNVDIFAKSSYVRAVTPAGTMSTPLLRYRSLSKSRLNDSYPLGPGPTTNGGVDEGTDPIDDPDADPRTMLLGRVYDFDSPLVFEPSPLRRRSTTSIGQVRLSKPGNKTEQGGSARWERVLQHDFELTVRGNIRYQLPLSARYQSAQIQGSVKVASDDSDGEPDEGKTGRWRSAEESPMQSFK